MPEDASEVKKSHGNYRSAGFMPCTADRLPKDVFKSLYFSTSTDDAFDHPGQRNGSSVSAQAAVYRSCGLYRPQSMIDIHGPNRLAICGKFERSKARGWSRDMCEYTKSYDSKPLDHVTINRQLHTLFKTQQQDSSIKTGGNMTKLADETTMKAEYVEYTEAKAKGAIPKSCKPAQVTHTNPDDKLLQVDSVGHQDFHGFTASKVAMARPESCKPKQVSVTPAKCLDKKSNYALDYSVSRYGKQFQKEQRSSPPTSGYTGIRRAPEGDKTKLNRVRVGDLMQEREY